MGDLNAALQLKGSKRTNIRGKELLEMINEGFLNCVESHPTLGVASGHKPMTFEISIETEPKPPSSRLSYNFKAAKWQKYRTILDEQLSKWDFNRSIQQAAEIEEYTRSITNSINQTAREAIP